MCQALEELMKDKIAEEVTKGKDEATKNTIVDI